MQGVSGSNPLRSTWVYPKQLLSQLHYDRAYLHARLQNNFHELQLVLRFQNLGAWLQFANDIS